MTVDAVFREQAKHCAAMGSPFMERLMNIAAVRLDASTPVGAKLWDWQGDIGPFGASLPLRWAGGLHALCLNGDGDLASVYPPTKVTDDRLWSAIATAMAKHEAFLLRWLDNAPQTNEVRRSAAILPAATLVHRLSGLPLAITELGASGGLNLNFDLYALETDQFYLGQRDPILTIQPDWRGDLPVHELPRILHRTGIDLSPIDAQSPEGALKLTAYLWPDQPDRIRITRAAISATDTKVVQADAAEWLTRHFALHDGTTQFLFHTVAWQYFPAATQKIAQERIEALGATATDKCPLAWFSMEKGDDGPGARLTMRYWPGDLTFDLGHADFHGRWIDWRMPPLVS